MTQESPGDDGYSRARSLDGTVVEQGAAGGRFEWGATGARALSPACAVVVVVDVLSFTTTVTLATGRGTEVIPCGDAAAARALATAAGTEVAVNRHEVDEAHPFSLSPATMTGERLPRQLVLPSPNGSKISAELASEGTTVVAASLRNLSSVANWILDRGLGSTEAPVAVIAVGERWADGSLRPAIEDLFGAGLLLSRLAAAKVPLSAEGGVAARAVEGTPLHQLADLVRASTSGTELRVAGYETDVELAVEVDADNAVPVLSAASQGFLDETTRRADR